jgi:hypothetical protein
VGGDCVVCAYCKQHNSKAAVNKSALAPRNSLVRHVTTCAVGLAVHLSLSLRAMYTHAVTEGMGQATHSKGFTYPCCLSVCCPCA